MSTFGNTTQPSRYSPTEKTVIGLCLVSALFCLGIFFNDDLSDKIFGFTEEKSSQPLLGRISYLQKDTRHKHARSFAWGKARKKQGVHLGDSVFTGESSSAEVTLNEGPNVNLGENSLVTFNMINEKQLANFVQGNFRFDVDGSITIGIQNKITTIKGHKSEVQVYLDDKKKPQLRVLKGEISVSENGSPAKVVRSQEFISLQSNTKSQPSRQTASHENNDVPLTISPHADEEVMLYTRRLYDLYEMNGTGRLNRRVSISPRVSLSRPFRWNMKRGDEILVEQQVRGELAPSRDFGAGAISFASKESGYSTKEVFSGDNYWRISADGKSWSDVLHFKVELQDLDASIQVSREHQGNLTLSNEVARTSLAFQPSQAMRGFILEASTSPDFPDHSTRIHWLTKGFVDLSFNKAGRYYYRVRGANSATELTPPSATEEIIVEPPIPRRLAGMTVPKPKVTSAIKKDSPHVIAKKEASVEKPKAVTPPPLALKQPERQRRQPSSVSTSSLRAPPVEQGPINQGYSSSKLELETGAFTVYSPDESDVGRKNPMALIVGLRSHHWFGTSGLEAAVRVKAANANATAEGINPLQIEGRYMYKLNPDAVGRTQFSLLGGLEMYRNVGRGYFAQKYDLAKVGLSLDFPVRNRWDMGGEILYGHSLDSSAKYEIAGRVNYYLQKDWSFGVGYRFHHFKAGSEKTAPLEFPYKETYGEGYSVLQWHY